ncbi:MFS transporter [Verrucomicrobiales bacterium]|nr:MFS transporter [bacterium]MDB4662055.1 MFS transporter [Verrucomicrobiales bacterium]
MKPPNSTDPPDSIANETLAQQVRALPRVVWVIFIGVFIHRFGTFVVPFLTLYLNESGYSVGRIAWVFVIWAIGGIGAMIAGGRLSDLMGRKNTMSLALISGGISMLFLWQADTYPLLLVAVFFSGLTHGMYHPAASSLLADVVPADRRVTAYGVVRWAINLGFACGMAAGGFLAEIGYKWLFIGDFITSVTYGIIAFFLLPHGLRTTAKMSRWAPALRDMLGNRRFVLFFFANLLAVSSFFQWGSSGALLIIDLGYPKSVYGWIMAGNGLLIAFLELPISQLGRKRNPRHVIALGFLLCGVGVSLCGFANGWVMIVVAVLVFTLGEMISMPVSGAYVAELAPEKMRGRYNAAVGLTWNLGHAISPGAGLLLYKSAPNVLWVGMALLGLVSGALMMGRFNEVSEE